MMNIDDFLKDLKLCIRCHDLDFCINRAINFKDLNGIDPQDLLDEAKLLFNSQRFECSFVITSALIPAVIEGVENKLAVYSIAQFSAKKLKMCDKEELFQNNIKALMSSDDSELHKQYGNVLSDLNFLDDAEKEYLKAIELNPENFILYYDYALLLSEMRRYSEAEDQYIHALRLKPDDIDSLHNYAELLSELERYSEAIEQYRKIISLTPDNIEEITNYTITLSDAGQDNVAEQEYLNNLKQHPDEYLLHYYYASFLSDVNRLSEAEEQYKLAIKLKPDDIDSYNDYGLLLLESDRLIEAAEQLKNAIRIQPDHSRSQNNYAIALSYLNRFQEAETRYNFALKIDPEDAGTHNNYALFLHDLKRDQEAENHFLKALTIAPDYARAHSNYANFLFDSKRNTEAEVHYLKSLELDSTDALTNNNYTIFLSKNGQYRQAEYHIKIALEKEGNNPKFLKTYGNLLADQLFLDEALNYYEKALSYSDLTSIDRSEIINNIGWLQSKKHNYSQAQENFRIAYALDEKNVKAQFNLREIKKYIQQKPNSEISELQFLAAIIFLIPIVFSILFFIFRRLSEQYFSALLMLSVSGIVFCILYKDFKTFSVGKEGLKVEMNEVFKSIEESFRIER